MTTKLIHEMDITTTTEQAQYSVEGLVLLETMEKMPEEMKLTAYVFDPLGKLLGFAPLDAMGRFNVPLQLRHAADVQLVVGPAGEPETLRAAMVYKETFHARDWLAEGHRHLLKARVFLSRDMWTFWRPLQIGIAGHVRTTGGKPIPYLKVEIFDVDREPYPIALHLEDQKPDPGLKALRVPDLLAKVSAPSPAPGAEPVTLMAQAGPKVPEPAAPEQFPALETLQAQAAPEWLKDVTLLSKTPPWNLTRWYSKQLLDTVHTDPQGGFTASFPWFRFHVRNGRLRHDARPDIIVRVTQVIDGVARVLYMDPYASTRWNVTNAQIDLWLDDPEFLPGNGASSTPVPGLQAFFTRVGNDEVFQIDQTTGLYSGKLALADVAYGHVLHLHGNLGKNLGSGPAKRYYRMSCRKGATGDFTWITTPMTDTRVNTTTLIGETHSLGPKNVNGTMGLYEVRDLEKYYWYNPDWLMEWNTAAVEAKTGLYTLRLEVFDENGKPLANVDYRDGTANSPIPSHRLPKVEHCDLVLAVQNLRPTVHLEFLNVPDNGVIPFSPAQDVKLKVSVSQENGLIYCWGLYYAKGLDLATTALPVGGTFYNGASAVTSTLSVTVSDLGITGSNTVAFKLWAWSHIRNGYSNYVYENEQVTGIAFQDCTKKAKTAQYVPALPT